MDQREIEGRLLAHALAIRATIRASFPDPEQRRALHTHLTERVEAVYLRKSVNEEGHQFLQSALQELDHLFPATG